MKKLFFSFLFVMLGMSAFGLKTHVKTMPVTTASEKARKLNAEAMKVVYEEANMPKFEKMANDALREDPDFFMVNYGLALYYF